MLEFLLVAAALSTVSARAQTRSGRPLIVYLAGGSQWSAARYIGLLQQGLRNLNWIENRDFDFAARYADGHEERLPALAGEEIAMRPAVIVAGSVDAAVAAKNKTASIPIVSATLAGALHLGLVASYNHPGGNVTGITPYVDGLPAKQIELALEVVPEARKIGLLGNLNDPKAPPQADEMTNAGKKLGVALLIPKIVAPDDLPAAVDLLARERVDVAICLQTTMMLSERRQLAQLTAAHRLPTVYGYREHVDEGGLVSYGVDLSWCWRHLAVFVDKILRGADPGDLPVEFPSKLQMVVNLKTAKALGITLAPVLLAQADEIIE